MRFYADQKFKPDFKDITQVQSSRGSMEEGGEAASQEEQKLTSRKPLEPVYPTPSEEMIAKVKS